MTELDGRAWWTLLLSDRKVDGEPWAATALKAVLLTGWAAAVLTVYRFVLFFTAFCLT